MSYARMGLPGCIGSIDATFEPWDKVCNLSQFLNLLQLTIEFCGLKGTRCNA